MERTMHRTVALDGDVSPFQLRLLELPLPEAPAGGLIAEVTMSGVCGTDAHRLSGDVAPRPWLYAFGHEPVGRVLTLGAGCDTDAVGAPLRPGDRILWSPAAAFCGECPSCVRGDRRGCEEEPWPYPAKEPNPAGYQDVAVLSRHVEVYRLPDDVPDEAFVALGCALPTAITGQDRLGRIKPGHSVVVQGSGPVGLASTVLAALEGPAQLIVIGTPADRLDWARRLGATQVLDLAETTSEERRRSVLESTGGAGADVVIEAAGQPEAFAEGLDLLARGGRYLISGLYSGSRTVPINPVIINNRTLTIIGNLGANQSQRRRAVELSPVLQARYSIGDLVTHRFPLEKTEDAIRSSGSGTVPKAVVVP